jgi:C1A family cysteine protease
VFNAIFSNIQAIEYQKIKVSSYLSKTDKRKNKVSKYMKEYFPTAKDIAELNEAAEQLTPKAIKSEPLSKLVKATIFYKTLSKSNCPDCVDMELEGITPKGKLLATRIHKECDYTTTKPDYLK